MTTSAFVSPFGPAVRTSSFTTNKAVSLLRPAGVSVPRMALQTPSETESDTTFTKLKADRAAKIASEYRGPQGFTPYAEKVNGRLAQLGFFIGLVTELASGKPIGQQILIMFSPLTNAVGSLLHAIN